MKIGNRFIQLSILRPGLVTALMVIIALGLGALIVKVKVDTDPENMLSRHEAVRVFHDLTKKEFNLYDVVVLGVVNDTHPDGVFNPQTLRHALELSRFAATLADPDDPAIRVVSHDIIAPDNVDTIQQAGLGQVRFDWLMKKVPQSREECLKIRELAMGNHLLKGTLVSEDGRAIGIYLPITSKDFAHAVSRRLQDKIKEFSGDDQFFITGLPVAEDTFGKEMFIQMAISAPLAMLAIFLLMQLFFKKIKMIMPPMIIAMFSVICTMGVLIGTGNTLHIMSSMIPIFLMPIAVVDSIHILSEFFDRYQLSGDRRRTIEEVMNHLFMPMLYTSLTSCAGFASLALTPIPPVQVFGIFVAFGIMLAWLATIVFIPAYVMMVSEESLADFGITDKSQEKPGILTSLLRGTGSITGSHAKLIISAAFIMLIISGYGISKIQVNDNPMNWFTANHPIRVADRVLNHHFSGTYEAYLVLGSEEGELSRDQAVTLLKKEIDKVAGQGERAKIIALEAKDLLDKISAPEFALLLRQTREGWLTRQDEADDAGFYIWDEIINSLELLKISDQIFKRPDVLRYIENLQNHLEQIGVVGKSNSVADVVKKVYQELFEGKEDHFRVPDTVGEVAQSLISFQNSHKPDDLWHLVTPDYKKANIWLQLRNGDNKLMESVVAEVENFMAANPPPVELSHQWAGLTYLNVVWQEKMVTGMKNAFLGSFLIVFIMMVILFRSVLWGALAMIPLSVTITFIYGIIGLVGKDYDMPVAVLSSLTLGLAVDFAIHFLERARETYKKLGSWTAANREMFAEPARAISRNVVVIAVGFTPLLAAPLVPYKTVGVFLASIMIISGLGTMLILPAVITLLKKKLFYRENTP